jgi:predicted ABC-class ATPase
VKTIDDLLSTLRRIDGRGYKAYKDIRGRYACDGYELLIDHVQGDPFADPSRLRWLLPPETCELPGWSLESPARRVATADFLNRRVAGAFQRGSGRSGSGKSGLLSILRPGQAVLERSSLVVRADGEVEVRFQAGLPAAGRRVLGREAAALLDRALDDAVEEALLFPSLDAEALRRHVETVEDARALRAQLEDRGLVAFVAEGAVLPRRSGADDRPLGPAEAVPFEPPEALAVELVAPNAGPLRGLGVPAGVTLIVGGGFHGKSTLLRALERGVYDHVPDDGRERVVTVQSAVKVRAEDGRAVTGTDISNFIDGLPGGQDTRAFHTRNASGSTSQAASLVEALEQGAACLLMDEDTSATNLMLRDARMQALVARDREPITPFIDRVRQLSERGVSTVLVVGGAGDYFDVADAVVAMDAYRPREVTAAARKVAADLPSRRRAEAPPWRELAVRVPSPSSIDPGKGRRARQIKTPAWDRLLFGVEEVRLGAVEQLVERAQARAIGEALAWARGSAADGRRTVSEVVEAVMAQVEREGLVSLQERLSGDLAAFRRFELAAVLSRLRMLQLARPSGGRR